MTLIQLIVSLIVIGVLLWLVNTYIPMDAKIKQILNIVVVVVVVLWLLSIFGLLPFLNIKLPHAGIGGGTNSRTLLDFIPFL